jgi:hypothetical protein
MLIFLRQLPRALQSSSFGAVTYIQRFFIHFIYFLLCISDPRTRLMLYFT